MNTGPKRQQQRRSNMNELIQEYLNTPNIPQRKFCELHQIPLSTFQYNLRKYRQRQSGNTKKQKARFIPVTLTEKDSAAKTQSACEIAWPNGLVIRFDSTPGVDYLLSLIAVGASRV